MHQSSLLSTASLMLAVARTSLAGTYTLNQNNVGSSFLDNFTWETFEDPTGGRVNYVDQATALSANLTYTSSDTFIMRVDSTTVLSSSDPGRNSVRIKSNALYNTHVAVFDIRHMPQGCATWPAIWEADDSVGLDAGEIDILEGVNDVEPNSVTLHTSGNCSMPADRNELGTPMSNDCGSSATLSDGNDGCSVNSPYTSSYGPTFNNNGGGWYVLERTAEFLSVWFWARTDGSVPSVVSGASGTIDTSELGTPQAYFPNTQCDLADHFSNNNIIVDITLCGSWAGARFNAAGCPGNCTDYVNMYPSNFTEAYWDFAAARVYLPTTSSSSNSSARRDT
ncbi:endo-1,3(4)-beta-glucanase-like protein [Amylocystis lapponica]|nr:endo-1,3(4)-beta-glucanase-like protein [Amylocystis lapponica]